MMSKAVRLGLALALPCVFVASSSALAQGTAAPPAAAQKPADTAALPSAQTIIDKHIAAIGGRKALQAHSSVAVKGTLSIPANGMSGAVEMYAARPNKSFTKTTVAGIGDISEGFDGTTAWSMSPMTGPMLATGEELAQREFNSNFDRTLGMADAYESMKTVEKTTFDATWISMFRELNESSSLACLSVTRLRRSCNSGSSRRSQSNGRKSLNAVTTAVITASDTSPPSATYRTITASPK